MAKADNNIGEAKTSVRKGRRRRRLGRAAATGAWGYSGSVTTTGNSRALLLEKAFFSGNPEFGQKAKVRAHVIGKGQVLLSIDEPSPESVDEDVIDPVMSAFLAFLERDLVENPSKVRPLEVERLGTLLAGVEPMRDDEALPDDFVL